MPIRHAWQYVLALVAALLATPSLAAAIVDAAAVKVAQARGAIVWDVRATPLYRKGHIPGAVSIGDAVCAQPGDGRLHRNGPDREDSGRCGHRSGEGSRGLCRSRQSLCLLRPPGAAVLRRAAGQRTARWNRRLAGRGLRGRNRRCEAAGSRAQAVSSPGADSQHRGCGGASEIRHGTDRRCAHLRRVPRQRRARHPRRPHSRGRQHPLRAELEGP